MALGRTFEKLIRLATAGLLAGALVGSVAVTPADAQRRGERKAARAELKKERKQERKRERAARRAQRDPVTTRRAQRYRYDKRRHDGVTVYDYRNSPVDPYAAYPQYRENPYRYPNRYPQTYRYDYPNYPAYRGYPYGGYYGYRNDSRYYSDRDGDLSRSEVARRAAQIGYYDGYQRGAYDRAQGIRRPNPTGHGAYQNAFHGFDPDWGYALTFQQYYRQYFLQGYQAGYGSRIYDRRYQRRWW